MNEMKVIIREMVLDITGEETAHNKCVKVYHESLEYPSDLRRELLRKAYEAIPESERMFLGDMDSKDGDYRRILYHSEKKGSID